MRRDKDTEWGVLNSAGKAHSWEAVIVSVLMDLRDELKRLNSAIYCHNFQRIPTTLRGIQRNTAKRRKKRQKTG